MGDRRSMKMAKKPIIKRGFKAVKEEEERREKAREASQGKLWRVFFPAKADEDYEIPFTFLTAEPICFYEHTVKIAGKYEHHTCTGDGCPYCEDGNKPRFVGAFLGIDHTEYEVDERDSKGNKTGNKTTVDAKVKLLVRGQTDLALLDRLNRKNTKHGEAGLLRYAWSIYKTGSDTSTKWNFDKMDLDEYDLSDKEIQAILPESLRGQDFYDIVEAQITPSEDDEYIPEDDDEADVEEAKRKINRNVQRVDDDDEEEDSRHKSRAPRSGRSSKSHRKIRRK